MGRDLKYSIFIHPSLHFLKTITTIYIEIKKKPLLILNKKIKKIFHPNRKTRKPKNIELENKNRKNKIN
jgi:hypothetical protein